MPGQGRVVERAYMPFERAALGDAAPVLGRTTFDIYLNPSAFWCNVPAAVWTYKLGGYQVLKKWLSYRERSVLDRALTPVRLEYLILSLNPGLRQRCVAPGVWPTTQRGAQPRVVEGPHAVDLRRRTHGGPCRVENTFFRDTSIIGDGLGARSPAGQGSEVVLGL